MVARKPTSHVDMPPHVFAPNPYGPRTWDGKPTECEVCSFPPKNGVHKTPAELVADLPPVPEGDVSDRIIGEG